MGHQNETARPPPKRGPGQECASPNTPDKNITLDRVLAREAAGLARMVRTEIGLLTMGDLAELLYTLADAVDGQHPDGCMLALDLQTLAAFLNEMQKDVADEEAAREEMDDEVDGVDLW